MATKPARTSQVFSKNPMADIILRSADNVDFHAARYLLSSASPIFANMFRIPSAVVTAKDGDEMKDGLRVVKLAEYSPILERMLLLCCPSNLSGAEFSLKDLDTAAALLCTLTKYEMGGSYAYAWKTLYASSLVGDDPIRAFAVACRVRDLRMAKLAARYLAWSTVHQVVHKQDPVFNCFTFLDLIRAEEYREKCVYRVEEGLGDELRGEFCFRCTNKHCGTSWSENYLDEVTASMCKIPCGAVALNPLHQSSFKGLRCKQCLARAAALPSDVSTYIEEEVENIELDFGW